MVHVYVLDHTDCLCSLQRNIPGGDIHVYQKRQSLNGRNLSIEMTGAFQEDFSPSCLFYENNMSFGTMGLEGAKKFKSRHIPPQIDSDSNRTIWFS